jgi:hypothetical protein
MHDGCIVCYGDTESKTPCCVAKLCEECRGRCSRQSALCPHCRREIYERANIVNHFPASNYQIQRVIALARHPRIAVTLTPYSELVVHYSPDIVPPDPLYIVPSLEERRINAELPHNYIIFG